MVGRWFVLVATIVFWSLAFTAIKYSVSILDPFELAAIRFAVADALFITSIAVERCKISREDVPAVFVLGLFGVTIYHVCLNAGEIYISSGVASLIISTAPAFVLILSRIFLSEKITYRKVLGISLAFLGVATISEPKVGNAFGILLTFISSISAAIYTVLGKRLMLKYDPSTITNYAMILGSIPLIPFSITAFAKTLTAFDPNLSVSIVFLGVFSTYLGYKGWFYFLRTEEASKASVFLLAIPFVSIIAGALLLAEPVSILTLIGGFMVVAGIFLVIK